MQRFEALFRLTAKKRTTHKQKRNEYPNEFNVTIIWKKYN